MTGTTKRGPQCCESLQCWICPSQWDQAQLLWVSGTRAKLCRIHRSLKSEERLKEHSYRRVSTTRTCYYCLYLLCSDFLRAPEITQPLQSCASPSFFPFSGGREIGSYYVFLEKNNYLQKQMYFNELILYFPRLFSFRFLAQSRCERQVAFDHILLEPSYTEASYALCQPLGCETLGELNITMLDFI